jgi:PAS domain S-box-containing protein
VDNGTRAATEKIETHTHDKWEVRRLAAIVESTDDAIIGASLSGNIVSWNSGAEQLLGYSAEEAIGKPFAMIVPEDLAEERRAMVSIIARGERIHHYETRRRHRNGTDVDVSVTISPITDAGDNVVGVSCILRDVSDRKRAEAEGERLKSEFFSLVSHELRTPLTSIVGYVQLLTDFEDESLSGRGREFLEIIRRNAERLDGLVQDVLFAAQSEASAFTVVPTVVDARRLADRCRREAETAAETAGVALSWEIGPVRPFGGDPDRLTQVLRNLISNAIKFTPEGGRVDVRVFAERGCCVLEVSDTGQGIEPEERDLLFERFYRSEAAMKDHVKGAGLGLAIVKAIVDAHGGTIDFESELGQGSTFRVSLPMRPCEGDPATRQRRRPNASGKRRVAEVRR